MFPGVTSLSLVSACCQHLSFLYRLIARVSLVDLLVSDLFLLSVFACLRWTKILFSQQQVALVFAPSPRKYCSATALRLLVAVFSPRIDSFSSSLRFCIALEVFNSCSFLDCLVPRTCCQVSVFAQVEVCCWRPEKKMDPYGPPRKRPRPDQTTAAHNGVNGHGLGVTQAPGDHDSKFSKSRRSCETFDVVVILCWLSVVAYVLSVRTNKPLFSPPVAELINGTKFGVGQL